LLCVEALRPPAPGTPLSRSVELLPLSFTTLIGYGLPEGATLNLTLSPLLGPRVMVLVKTLPGLPAAFRFGIDFFIRGIANLLVAGTIPNTRKGTPLLTFHMGSSRYRDTGCSIHPSCLQCPLPKCRYDEDAEFVEWNKRNNDRDREIKSLYRKGAAPGELASAFDISTRTVHRVITGK
jgi:hypothetical protein